MRIVCFGPGPRFKGGISNYNTSLARTLDRIEGTDVHIVSWTQQYPAIIPREFVDKASRKDFLEGTKIQVSYLTNYNNPFSWQKTYRQILDLKPDIVIFQWAIAIQGLPMGYIARKLKRHPEIEVIFDCHVVVQKENSSVDRIFSRMGLRHAHTYIVHAYKTADELKSLFPEREFNINEDGQREKGQKNKVIKLFHPIYDLFSPDPDFDVEKEKKALGLRKHVFLFFGFIRKYKGLHQAIRAFGKLAEKRDDVSLLICGESFWQTLDQSKFSTRVKNAVFGLAKKILVSKADDEREYRPLELIRELGLEDRTVVKNEFVPNEDVHRYFQVSDCVVLYYLTATPSGIESLSYNFQLPILATDVGHFPETIKDGFNGYLAKDGDIEDMAACMERFLEKPVLRENVDAQAKHMSWKNYVEAILRPYGGGEGPRAK